MAWTLPRVPWGKSGTPSIKTSVRVLGDRQIDVFEAMCLVRGRQAHELAADLVLEAVRVEADDPNIADIVRVLRKRRRQLHVVPDRPEATA